MADVFSKEKRSDVMSRIRGKGNKKTELALIEILKAHQIVGWRRNARLFGRPDFVFFEHKLAVFVDGCFWHGCAIHSKIPTTNRSFWQKKISTNRARDLVVTKTLKKRGWRVMRLWEHDLKKRPRICARRILRRVGSRYLPPID
jgi:DNA mismatch endonuclease (patch repair protein)